MVEQGGEKGSSIVKFVLVLADGVALPFFLVGLALRADELTH